MTKTPSQFEDRKNELSLKTLGLLHRYLDDFVIVGKARRGELSSAELETLLRKAAMDAEEIRQILQEYKRVRQA
ncbi:MAG: hypothetical protein WBG50_26180 [Desulfomonilaceae bacterium]